MRDLLRVFGITKGLAALALCCSLHRSAACRRVITPNCGNGGNNRQGKDRSENAANEPADATCNEDGGS
jgi:hypothetical protein